MRDRKQVLTNAFAVTKERGRHSQAVTMFRHDDGPGFVRIHTGERGDAASVALRDIERVGGTAVFSLLPNGGAYDV